jgi:hypothetical protein
LYSKYAIFILFLSAVGKNVFTAGLQRDGMVDEGTLRKE